MLVEQAAVVVDALTSFITSSDASTQAFKTATLLKTLSVNALIYGEHGVGKKTLSKYLIIVNIQNKKGELAKLISEISKLNINIVSMELGVKSDFCQIEVEIDKEMVDKLAKKLKQNYQLVEFVSIKDAYNKPIV